MLKIYGFEPSAWTNAVRFTANALDLDYEFVRINLVAGEGQQPWYLAIQPAGKVPAIDDDGFPLFESGAIQRYLARKAGSELYPESLQAQAIVDAWSLFTSLHVASAMTKVAFNRAFYKLVGLDRNMAELEEGERFLGRFLPIVDVRLGQSRFLASDRMSIADITLLAWLDPAELSEVDLGIYPNLTRWRAGLKAESFYMCCHHDYAEMFRAVTAHLPTPKVDARVATA